VELWAGDLERLLDGLDVERAALVGHSVGCMVAEHAAVRLGDRVWALAVLGGALEWPDGAKPAFEQRAALARDGRMDEIAAAVTATGLTERCRREEPALHGLMLELIASNDPDAYAESALATGAGSMREPDRVGCPVLAFCGAEDPVTPPSFAEAIAAAVQRGETATVEAAAHWCMLERPGGVSAALLVFLDRSAPRT
jgi:pimeloyl-ACP methyl ester carboxylesterase